MANPYNFATQRYENKKIQTQIKSDPVGELAKIMGIADTIHDIRASGDEAFSAMCGVMLYRQLSRQEKRDVMERIMSLQNTGYIKLAGRLRCLIASGLVQPQWQIWSLSVDELNNMVNTNKNIKDFLDKSGLNFNPTAVGVAAFLYGSSKHGIKSAASSTLGGKGVSEFASKQGLPKTAARVTGYAYIITVVFATILANMAKHDEKRAASELDSRRSPPNEY